MVSAQIAILHLAQSHAGVGVKRTLFFKKNLPLKIGVDPCLTQTQECMFTYIIHALKIKKSEKVKKKNIKKNLMWNALNSGLSMCQFLILLSDSAGFIVSIITI
jgi:hypothetical protein